MLLGGKRGGLAPLGGVRVERTMRKERGLEGKREPSRAIGGKVRAEGYWGG